MPSAAPLKMTRVLSSLRHPPSHVAELALTASRRRRLGRARPLPRTVGVAPPHGPRHSDWPSQDDLVHRPCAAARNSKPGYARLTQNTQGGMLIWGFGGAERTVAGRRPDKHAVRLRRVHPTLLGGGDVRVYVRAQPAAAAAAVSRVC